MDSTMRDGTRIWAEASLMITGKDEAAIKLNIEGRHDPSYIRFSFYKHTTSMDMGFRDGELRLEIPACISAAMWFYKAAEKGYYIVVMKERRKKRPYCIYRIRAVDGMRDIANSIQNMLNRPGREKDVFGETAIINNPDHAEILGEAITV
jgi:hypothetical protein